MQAGQGRAATPEVLDREPAGCTSTAQTMPCSSGVQKPLGSWPRTPRHSTAWDSSSLETAASLRIAAMTCVTVAASVRRGCCSISRR